MRMHRAVVYMCMPIAVPFITCPAASELLRLRAAESQAHIGKVVMLQFALLQIGLYQTFYSAAVCCVARSVQEGPVNRQCC